MLRKLLLGLAVFAVSMLVFGVIGEIAVRLLADDTVMFPRYHTRATYGEYQLRTIRPHARFTHSSRDGSWEFVTNAQGFRDTRDFQHAKPPGVVRVVVLGDSHTQGYEARQDRTFSAVLERWLDRRGIESEVLNTGVSGFSTAEELLLLENEGFLYQPDYVVLALFGNDYEDNVKTGLFGLDASGQLVALKKEHLPGVKAQDLIYRIPGVAWLGEHSHLYSLVFNNVWLFFKTRLARDRAVELAVPGAEAVGDAELALMRALLERLHRDCQARGVKLIVLDIPTVKDRTGWASSALPAIEPDMARYADVWLPATATLAEYDGAAEIHVPHGHRHISEFTHLALGIALGEAIRADRAAAARP